MADRAHAPWHADPRRGEQPHDGREHSGVDIKRIFTAIFALGAGLAALAGGMAGSILAVQVGMGEEILILAFVVIVIGGLGSIKGALVGALLVGIADTLGRILLPDLFGLFFRPSVADGLGGAVGSMVIYLLMAAVLFYRPRGLFSAWSNSRALRSRDFPPDQFAYEARSGAAVFTMGPASSKVGNGCLTSLRRGPSLFRKT